jgi:uncharacterized protein (DUF486 family)
MIIFREDKHAQNGVPADAVQSVPQLKIIQEVITLVVFAGFAWLYLGTRPTLNWLWAGCCLMGAVFFLFRDFRTVS